MSEKHAFIERDLKGLYDWLEGKDVMAGLKSVLMSITVIIFWCRKLITK